MGGNDQDINLTIRAKDDATDAIKKLTSQVEALSKKMGEASKSSNDLTKSQAATAASHESMTESVFKGVAAWDLFKKAVGTATDFLMESTQAYLEAQKQTDLTRATVESMGKSFDVVGPKLKAFGDRMAKLGTDDEAAALAAAKLAKVTGGDLKKGMDLAKLAADLTASGFNDFEGNVDNLTRVLTGKGQRALMDYRVNLADNATTAEQLAAIQGKVTQTAEQYADTIPGKIAIVKTAYGNLKEEIGQSFVIALQNAFIGTGDLSAGLDGMNQAAKYAGLAVFEIVTALSVLVKSFQVAGNVIAELIIITKNWRGAVKGDATALAEINSAIKSTDDAVAGFKQAVTDMLNPTEAIDKAQKKSTETTKLMASSYKADFKTVTNANTSATDSITKLKDKYKSLSEALTAVRQTSVDELASISKAHDESVKSSTARITELQKSLSDLTDQYTRSGDAAAKAFSQTAGKDKADVADQVVAEQKKIEDLKKQAGMETDPQKRINLMADLKKEEDAYAAQADFITSLGDALTEAKRKSSLTEFERAIEDYKAKRVQADQEYADNRADAAREFDSRKAEIKLQLLQEQTKMDEETAKYKKAHDAITAIIDSAEALRLDITKKTTDQIIKLVDAQIERYNRLADAIQRASQGKPGQITQVSQVPIKEFGGLVPGPEGVPVPIIAHGQERVVPASQTSSMGGGGNISVVINNPSVRNDQDLNDIRDLVEDALRDISRVHKLTTI